MILFSQRCQEYKLTPAVQAWNPNWVSVCHQGGSPECILSKSGKKKTIQRGVKISTQVSLYKGYEENLVMEQQAYENHPFHPVSITQRVNNCSQALCLEQDQFLKYYFDLHRHLWRDSACFKIHPVTTQAAFSAAPTAPVSQCLRQSNQFCLLVGFTLERMRQ